ncbi:MAG: glycerol kinase GlpK [Eubacteriales bacterium]|nr:glycerol kinase GlpK [Eubacteriales bacterium]
MTPTLPVLLTLDQGTTSSRTLAFDARGQMLASSQKSITQSYPHPGWVEEDPEEIFVSQLDTLLEVMAQLENRYAIGPDQIAGVGITNQRETIVVWDRLTGRPVYPAIVWQCRRTADICTRLREAGHEALIRQKTGLVLDAYFSATKWMWLFEQDPGLKQRAEQGEILAGTVDTWLIWRLTAGRCHVTDVSNASRTLLMNLQTGQWDDELLALFGIPRAMLPRIISSAGRFGTIDSSLVPGGLVMAGLAGDQQAALFGQACFSPGMTKNTYGTGCFMLMQTGSQPVFSHHGLLATVAWDIGEGLQYALEGSVFNAGSAIQWVRDELGLIDSAPDIDRLAALVPDTAGVQVVPAFTGLGAPYWDMHARGLICGITRGTNRSHIARAVLESIAHQSQDVLALMQEEAGFSIPSLRVDGGASVSDLLMQMQADISLIPVDRPAMTETTAFGAAALAGFGLGLWPSLSVIAGLRQQGHVFTPGETSNQRDEQRTRWQRAVAAARLIGGSEA